MKPEGSKLRILVGVAEPSARGGINACEPPFVSALRDLGHDVTESTYLFDNRSDTSLLKRVSQVRRAAAGLLRHMAADSFDVIHLNTSFELRSLLRDAYTLFKIGGACVFLKFHGSNLRLFEAANPSVRFLVNFVLRKAAGVGVLSNEERQAFIDSGFPSEKIFVVRNAVAVPVQGVFPHVEKVPRGATRLLFVSRLVSTKGLEDSIRAVALLRADGRDVVIDVLGEGEARLGAEALAAELGLGGSVHFHGHVDEATVSRFNAEADVLVFPTFHDEGFPMVIFNALRAGLPVVTTRIRAAADYLTDGQNILFCESHDPRSVAACISRLIDDSALAATLAEEGKALAARFSPEKVALEYAEIYRQMR